MRLTHLKNSRLALTLGAKPLKNSNFVDILTGQNGSGKTEVLASIIRYFRDNLKSDQLFESDVFLKLRHDGEPNKIVAQTFSPFSRFPAPRQRRLSTKYDFAEKFIKDDIHVSIGLSKNSKVYGGSLSTRILEDSIFRLANTPERIPILFSVLREIDFDTKFELLYEATSPYKRLFKYSDEEGDFYENFSKLIEQNKNSIIRKRWENLSKSKEFLITLKESIEIVSKNTYHTDKSVAYKIEIDDKNFRRDFYQIQAFSFLRRYGFLSLNLCQLYSPALRRYLDITETSSGQQQMLCALFGLATSVSDDCLVLIDEPELSLHPEWQLKFVDALFEIISNFEDTHVLIATHSPLVVQRASASGADLIQLGEFSGHRHLSATDQTSVSIEEALVDVFRTPIADSTHVSNEIFHAIVQGETGDNLQKSAALSKLSDLQRIYGENKDPKTTQLISDAIRLINMPNTPSPENGEFQRRG